MAVFRNTAKRWALPCAMHPERVASWPLCPPSGAPNTTCHTWEKSTIEYDIANIDLAEKGLRRMAWAQREMPVLDALEQRFAQELPFNGIRLAACMHVTTETAHLVRVLQAGGAELALCASNPLSTQDDVAAALLSRYEVPVFAVRGESPEMYHRHLRAVLDIKPHLTMDDGMDLLALLHTEADHLLDGVHGGTEETTTGVIRLKAMAQAGALKYPVMAVNDAQTKHLFDNRYGTGQSSLDGIIRATNILLAGRNFVVAGYGWCSRGIAQRARGHGSKVIVTEVEPVRALEAVMDGYQVMPMSEAVQIGEVFCSATGCCHILDAQHFAVMRDGAVMANSGHFDIEINLEALAAMSRQVERIRDNLDEYHLADGRCLYVVGEGRLVNLAAAEGHPSTVMDMSFANQALAALHMVRHGADMTPDVHQLPHDIDEQIARLKLEAMGVQIDSLTTAQSDYLHSWSHGT